MEADLKTLKAIASTIKFAARKIRQSEDLEETKLLALAKIIHNYSTLLAISEPQKVWDYTELGNPKYYAALGGSNLKDENEDFE